MDNIQPGEIKMEPGVLIVCGLFLIFVPLVLGKMSPIGRNQRFMAALFGVVLVLVGYAGL